VIAVRYAAMITTSVGDLTDVIEFVIGVIDLYEKWDSE
jgi:hypothetical protein